MTRMPFAPGAARELLLADDEFVGMLAGGTVTTRELPDPLVGPCVTISAGVNRRQNPGQSQVRLMISVWVPKPEILVDRTPPILTDPEELAWDIADAAGRVLARRQLMGRGASFTYRGMTWRGIWDMGPTTLVDTARGKDNPLYRSIIEVVMKAGTAPAAP
ncbi:MAG: hypothetical protein QM809_11490 [Gordonia sp. (in: high G+C Gram-positive bacteria)]|uniref:hypothetical protein n=1 Tax=Gordonia sp. (in: high G+C Gram-positive bacteria) TaxID=84139 RepID=UPI0039E49FEF